MKTRYKILIVISVLLLGILIPLIIEYVDYRLKIIEFEKNCKYIPSAKDGSPVLQCISRNGMPPHPHLQIFIDEFFSCLPDMGVLIPLDED